MPQARLQKTTVSADTAAKVLVHGQSTCRAFVPGFRFDLEDHPRSSWNTSYLLTEVVHQASEEAGYVAGGRGQGEVAYRALKPAPAKRKQAKATKATKAKAAKAKRRR